MEFEALDTIRTTESKAGTSDRRTPPVLGFAAAAEQHLAADRVDAAREVCLQGVTQAPWYAPGHIVMAKVCLECGDYEPAEQSLREAIRLDPMNSVAYTLLGQALLLQDKREAAIKALDEALFLCPSNPLAAEFMRRATTEQRPAAAEAAPSRSPESVERPEPPSDEQEASTLRALAGVDGVLIATGGGLASAGTMGQGNQHDEALGASAATAMQTWKQSQSLRTFGEPYWAAVAGERGQLLIADAGGKMVLARFARRLRLGRVLPAIEAACRNLSE
jgi:predicted regulator of Ras-like GTPase activity (Roadblock/LC7/MglB family)